MAVSLSKGQRVDLTKTNPGLKKIVIGLGWDTNKYDGGHDFDLDASAFVLGASGKVKDEQDFVFYNLIQKVPKAQWYIQAIIGVALVMAMMNKSISTFLLFLQMLIK